MAYIIGSARIDERGQAAGGAAGDQTGKEVCTENYYVHTLGWYAYRAKDANVANALAKAMEQACANNHIGYDQNQRTGVITQLGKYGSLDKIAVNTECDCSSLVRACVFQATSKDPGNFTTYNEGKALEATGKFEARITVTNDTKLYAGDILVTRKKGHTAIVTKGEARKAETAASGSVAKSAGLNKTPQWVGEVTAARLNVRTWAGTENANIKSWPQLAKGNKVDVCDTVKAADGSAWYYVRIDGKVYGFVLAKWIRKE